MSVVKSGALALINKLDLSVGIDAVSDALTGLLGNGSDSIDTNQLVSMLSSKDNLSSLVESWLSENANSAISKDEIISTFGESNINRFGRALGIDSDAAAIGLTSAIPDILASSNKSHKGGS